MKKNTTTTTTGVMEDLTENPGLKHIAEDIFLNLKPEDLEKCANVNTSWNSIIRKPSFWLQKCIKNGTIDWIDDWKKAIQLTKNTNLEENITQYLEAIHNMNPNDITPSPIYAAAERGHTDVVKLLASRTEDPNAVHPKGLTPIYIAAMEGHVDIIKVLAPLTENPDAPGAAFGKTPMYQASLRHHVDVIRALVPFSDDPIAPWHEFVFNGHSIYGGTIQSRNKEWKCIRLIV